MYQLRSIIRESLNVKLYLVQNYFTNQFTVYINSQKLITHSNYLQYSYVSYRFIIYIVKNKKYIYLVFLGGKNICRMFWSICVPHEPITTVQGRPGMEAVDFLEKTTVAEHFGHLHELFIYDVRRCCRINPFDFTFSDLLPPRMPIWYPCMGSLIQQLCHSL